MFKKEVDMTSFCYQSRQNIKPLWLLPSKILQEAKVKPDKENDRAPPRNMTNLRIQKVSFGVTLLQSHKPELRIAWHSARRVPSEVAVEE
jgi:hypothetical protein